MTTRVTIRNEADSNPAQEVVVEVGGGLGSSQTKRANGTVDNSRNPVLRPGDEFEAWISSETRLTAYERDAKK